MAADDEWDLTGYDTAGSSPDPGGVSGPITQADMAGWSPDPGSAPIGPGAQSFWQRLGNVGTAAQGMLAAGGAGGTTKAPGMDSSRPLQYPNTQAPIPPGSAMVGHPSAPISLSQLVQMLMQRRNAYVQAANPLAARQVSPSLPSGQGLLGV